MVWLVRHGESTANAGTREETSGDTLLTPLGMQQAETVSLKLAEIAGAPTQIVVSSFERTQQTAAPYARRFEREPVIWPIQEWVLLNPSHYVGTTQAERQLDVEAFKARLDPYYADGGGSESFATFMARVDFFLVACLAWGGNIVAFTHGCFIQGVLWRCQNPSPNWGWVAEDMRSFLAFCQNTPIDNCQVCEVGKPV